MVFVLNGNKFYISLLECIYGIKYGIIMSYVYSSLFQNVDNVMMFIDTR